MTGRRSASPAAGRTSADLLTGLAAIAVLFVLLAGVPLALIAAFGMPVPHTLPSAALLTHRLGPGTVIRICSVVVWLAWLQLVWCVAVEVTAAVRNTGMPARVPLAGGTQALVHRLVTSALLLSTATTLSPALMAAPVVTVASAGALPGRPVPAPGPAAGAGNGQPGAARSGAAAAALVGAGTAAGGVTPGGPVAGGAARPVGAAATRGADAAELLAALSARPAGGRAAPAGDLAAAQHTEKIYVVKPPNGRFHESLWEIAERHLGDGRRYREIYKLNEGRLQPDGSRLTIASLIRPGWVLVMPPDAHGPGIEVIQPGQHGHPQPGPGGHHSEPGPGRHHSQPGPGRHHSEPGPRAAEGAPPGVTAPLPGGGAPAPVPTSGTGPSTPGPSTPGPSATGPARERPASEHPGLPGELPRLPLELAAAGLLAAGVLAALAARRRRQRGRRPYGRQLPPPGREAAWAEWAVRLGADENAAALVDVGLRYLSLALMQQDRVAPTVFAAHLGEDNLDLWVAPASLDAPGPWFAVGDGQVWRLPLPAVPGLLSGDLDAAAPYPGLVTIGTDATGRVLVDVASAHGLISVTGPDEAVRDALTAMATELATSRWSEGVQLTLVGFGAELAVLAPDRVRLVPTLAEALPELEAWAAEVTSAPGPGSARFISGSGPAGVPVPGSGPAETRAGDVWGQAWEPHYLITAAPPASAGERDRLLALARSGHAAGAAYLTAGGVPGASWTWEITQEGRLMAGQLGLDVAVQAIPHEQRTALADLFETAEDLTGIPLSAPLLEVAPAAHLLPEAELPVEVTLLGPACVRAPGAMDPGRLALATEIVVYLATHPGGVHPNVLNATVWPRGVTPQVRDAALDRVRDWLGSDGIGRPHLASDAAGRVRLGSGVRVDWQVFCTLAARARQQAHAAAAGPRPTGAVGGRGQDEASLLAQALNLVSGPFLGGREHGRYAWLAVDGLEFEVTARVADASHRLWELRLAGGDPHGAIGAIRAGLRIAGDDELLWRDLITATHATGEEHLLRSVIGELCDRARVGDRMPGLAPETEALIDELLPSWRWSIT